MKKLFRKNQAQLVRLGEKSKRYSSSNDFLSKSLENVQKMSKIKGKTSLHNGAAGDQ